MVTNGNHERFYDWAAYKARFTMPHLLTGKGLILTVISGTAISTAMHNGLV